MISTFSKPILFEICITINLQFICVLISILIIYVNVTLSQIIIHLFLWICNFEKMCYNYFTSDNECEQ